MMKLLGFLLSVPLILTLSVSAWAKSAPKVPTVYDFQAKTIDGKHFKLSKYKGKVLLVVNVASKCGHTHQYKGLEKLYEKYRDQGFEILGFPCNQFGSQEPGNETEIKTFCATNYGVKFSLFSKIEVNGGKTHPLYQFLKKALPGEGANSDIGWNFAKFLIDKNGHPLRRFDSGIEPEGVEEDVKNALKP